MPEALAAIMVAGLVAGLVGSLAGMRIDAGKTRARQAEARYVAILVEHAYRQGRLASDASSAADLKAALPHLDLPTGLGDGQAYRIAVDGADPRVLIDIETRAAGGGSGTRTEVVRAPFPTSELRIPFWRARQLRQAGQATR